jgi:hypothetical protein
LGVKGSKNCPKGKALHFLPSFQIDLRLGISVALFGDAVEAGNQVNTFCHHITRLLVPVHAADTY